ncbi:hypothetical protein [Pseudidiomarina homiensis]|uniref:hypothetical protein n=1 Tax=Pseudidiomarina homiensis TaxID=364198 RepID=UPI00215B2716|nr:hypothetical protein [Pseudidiomarina homiensis]
MVWNCLKNLLLQQSVKNKNSQTIQDDEICRRFLFDSNQFKNYQVKHQAFAPSRKTKNVSLFLKNRFESDEEYLQTRAAVSQIRGKECKAEGEFLACTVDLVRNEVGSFLGRQQFVLELDEHDFSHHANLDKWPSEKAFQKQLQQALAAKTKLIIGSA